MSASSFFSSHWSTVVDFAGMILVAFFVDFAFNHLVIVPLFGDDTLVLQCVLAVPIGVVVGLAWRSVWNRVRSRALRSESGAS